MDVLMDEFRFVTDPEGEGFPYGVVYMEFKDGERVLADLTTPVHDFIKAAGEFDKDPDPWTREQRRAFEESGEADTWD